MPNPAIDLLGMEWNLSDGKHVVITPSYRLWRYYTALEGTGHGQRPVLGVTPTFSRGRFTVSGRNRFCGRFVSSQSDLALPRHNTAVNGNRSRDEHLAKVCAPRDGKISEINTYLSDAEMVNAFFV